MNFSKAKTPGPTGSPGWPSVDSQRTLGRFRGCGRTGRRRTTARVFPPTVLQPAFAIRTQNFEAGRTGMTRQQMGGQDSHRPAPVAAIVAFGSPGWVGPGNNISTISQQVTVPRPRLSRHTITTSPRPTLRLR